MEALSNRRLGVLSHWHRRLLRVAFRLLYNQLAWSYDAVAWVVSLGQWKDWGRTAVPFLRGPRVLDLAHGPGSLLLELAAAGFQVVGYDLSPFMGRLARSRLARHGLATPLTRGMAQALPFPDGAFNSVVSTFPAEFIFDPATPSEIARVLAPGGVCVVVPFALPSRGARVVRALRAVYTTWQRPSGGRLLSTLFQAAGFYSQVHWISLPRSRVMVITNQLKRPHSSRRGGFQ